MEIIGVGNTGMTLAKQFAEYPILFSTAHQDTVNFQSMNVFSFSQEGASKRFKNGLRIWEDNETELIDILEDIQHDKVVIFSSLGGGSGSSSLQIISKILLQNNNKILIVGVLPYKKEINPPLANSVMAINNLIPLVSKVSIMLFDNEKLRKQYGANWDAINHHIIRVVDYSVNLLKFNVDKYSPLTLDQSELESVIFGGGFLDFSDTFLEERQPKFEYGVLDKEAKNCLVVMFVDKNIPDDEMSKYHELFTSVSDKIARKAKNARFIPGILRGSLNKTNSIEGVQDRAYITIVGGLNFEKYAKKLIKIRDLAMEKATLFNEKGNHEKLLGSKETRLLDL